MDSELCHARGARRVTRRERLRRAVPAAILSLIGTGFIVAFQASAYYIRGLPRANQQAVVSQTIGITELKVTYSRPAIAGREIWGKVVPWDRVWQPGRNENTVVTFSDPVQIEGQPLEAGSYGLHMIPGREQWTVIFSTNSTSWGSYTYNPEEDALRVQVKPQTAPHEEWLRYDFGHLAADSAELAMSWAGLRIGFKIEVETHELALAKIRDELRGRPGFYWGGWWSAADFCARNQINIQEALTWVDQSIALDENFANTTLRFELLLQVGRLVEAEEAFALGVGHGNEVQVRNLGYRFLRRGDLDRALETFLLNVTSHPDSWDAHDSLAEAYERSDDPELALRHYRLALELVNDETQQARIRGRVEALSE